MSLMTTLLILWGLLTGALVLLLIYRSTLVMHEDDQLFLDEAESHMQAEQTELMTRMNHLQPVVRWLGGTSAALIIFIGGLWLYEGIMRSHI